MQSLVVHLLFYERWRVCLTAVFACVVAACSSSSSNNPAPAASPAPSTLPNVQVALDTARAVSGTVSASGTTLVAQAANGATLTLTVPPGAVSSPVTVRMTPIAGVASSPLSGPLISGAHFEPEGLQFAVHATLAIRPATSVTPGFGQSIVGFGYSGSGDSFQLVPVSGADPATEATIEIPHFSGYGAGTGKEDEIDAMLSSMAQSILALVAGAESAQSLELLEDAYRQYSAWLGMANARPGKHETEVVSINDRMAVAVSHVVQRVGLNCRDNHDPSKALKIQDWRNAVLTKPEILSALGTTDPFPDAAQKCARFELSFDVTYVVSAPAGTITLQAKASVLLDPLAPPPPFLYVASGPITETVQWPSVVPPDCTQKVEGIDSTLTIVSATVDLNAISGTRGVTVSLDPGMPGERITFICPQGSSPGAVQNIWVSSWVLAHQPEMDLTAGGYVIAGWEPGAGDVYAKRSYSGAVPNTSMAVTENATLLLRHVPII